MSHASKLVPVICISVKKIQNNENVKKLLMTVKEFDTGTFFFYYISQLSLTIFHNYRSGFRRSGSDAGKGITCLCGWFVLLQRKRNISVIFINSLSDALQFLFQMTQ